MSNPIFTISQIAPKLGKTARAVQMAFERIPADGKIFVRGQQTDAWKFLNFPARYRSELERVVERDGYRNVEHLLGSPRERWKPPVPLNRIARIYIDRALKLRNALAPSLVSRNEVSGEQNGYGDFCRIFGRVSERHYRNLLQRTIRRDAGEERFDDLELYLDENACAARANRAAASVRTDSDRAIVDELNRLTEAGCPTLDQIAKVWCVVCEELDGRISRGEKPVRAQKAILRLLNESAVMLARSPASLRKQLRRKFRKWNTEGRTVTAIEDRRAAKSGRRAPAIDEEDRLKLIKKSRFTYDGRISQAWRDLHQSGDLSADLTSRYIANPASKSYVPATIRRAITHDVKRLKDIQRGPRTHKLNGAYHTRDWSGAHAGDFFQSDDLTNPLYFITDEGRIIQGQFLPMIDELTGIILGFVLIQQGSYNSLSIRSLITRVCSVHGLPRRGFYFERGIWQKSRLISGRRDTISGEIAETGLRRLGMILRHANLPRAKVVERTLGQIQNLMEDLPGYAGRSQRTDCFERIQKAKLDVEAGRTPAAEHFLNAAEVKERFAAICDRYNDEPQQGRLKGLSPNEAWKQWQGPEPRMRFDARLMYFLGSDLRRLKVGRNGLTITIGKQRFNYKGDETGKRTGETFLAWFNSEQPDLLTCTADEKGNGAFTVERSFELPSYGATREELAEENRKINDHQRYAANLFHVIKNVLPPSSYRGQVAGTSDVRLGEVIEAQQGRIRRKRAKDEELEQNLARTARRTGRPLALIRRVPESIEAMKNLAEIKERVDLRLAEEKQ